MPEANCGARFDISETVGTSEYNMIFDATFPNFNDGIDKLLSFTHENVKMLRSTHCAKCFKIKAEYKFDEVGLEDFENGDFLKISFTQPVELIKWTGALSNIYPTDSSKKVLALLSLI